MSISEFVAKPLLMIEYHPTSSIEIEEIPSIQVEEMPSIEIDETRKVSDLIKTFEEKCALSTASSPIKLSKKHTNAPCRNEKLSSLIQKFEATASEGSIRDIHDSHSVTEFRIGFSSIDTPSTSMCTFESDDTSIVSCNLSSINDESDFTVQTCIEIKI